MNGAQFQHLISQHQLLSIGDTVIVGTSSGPDSVALLALLCSTTLALKPIAVYVDHGLRPQEIPQEISCVKQVCQRYSVDYEIVKVDVENHRKLHKNSLEETSRILRYEALEQCRSKYSASAIAVAHTADDQAEEVLLRLFRGSGLKGLSGMKMKNGYIIRPLITTAKKELLKYIDDADLPYCTDSSNNDLSILRNRLRLEIFPQLTVHFNTKLQTTLCQTAELLSKEDDLVDILAQRATQECIQEKEDAPFPPPVLELDLPSFFTHHIALQRRIVEHICWKFGSQPSYQNINTMCTFARTGKSGGELHLPLGLRMVKRSNFVYFFQPAGAVKFRGRYHVPTIPPLKIEKDREYHIKDLHKKIKLTAIDQPPQKLEEGQLVVDLEKLSFPLILRTAQPGEKFRPAGMKGRKKVSRLFSDCKIPRQLRSHYPLLLSQDRIAAVVGLRVAQEFSVSETTTSYGMIIWNNS